MKTYVEPPLTIADLDATPDDGNRYELIEGELYVSTAPSFFHQKIVAEIMFAVSSYLREHRVGTVVPGPGIVFDDFNGVIPDIVFLTHERERQILADGRLTASPELVIEILSPGATNRRRDQQLKRTLYSIGGVHEYWIVDPDTRSVALYRKRKEGGLKSIGTLRTGEMLTSSVLPGFKIPVESIFPKQ